MTYMQQYALAHPAARANIDASPFRRLTLPWSLILTVNK